MSGRKATINIIPGDTALSVNNPGTTPKEDWLWVSLNEVAKMATGHTPSRNHPEYWGGDIPWIAVGDCRFKSGTTILETKECTNLLGIENSAAVLLPKGTVCLSRTGSIGYVVIMGKEMATSQGFVNWVCSKILLPRFLQLLFVAERSFLYKISEGTAHTTIYFPEVKAFNICLPPLPIQRAIIAKIEELFSDLDKGVAELKKAQDQLKVYRQAVLKKAFEGEYSENVKIELNRIGDHCKIVSGKAFKKSEYSDDGVRLFQIANVSFNKIVWNKIAHLPKSYLSEEKLKDLVLKEGDLVMALNRPMLNNELKIGILGKSDVPSILYQRVGKFVYDSRINSKYLGYFLQSPVFIKWLSKELQGVNIPFINQSNLLGFSEFPYMDIEFQNQTVQEIESRLSVCDKVEENITESLEKAKALRQSILKKAFEGDLLSSEELEKCKAAPDYEPAAVLLEKIKSS